jgi:hypothetical protein
VVDAAGYLGEADESLHDGYQTARDVLSHLVYWHREYVDIACALMEGRRPELKQGTYAELNAAAAVEFGDVPMSDLADRLLELQASLEIALRALPDWGLKYPVKHGSRVKPVEDRLPVIESHIVKHIKRLRRAERLGEDWVKAYYLDAS